MRALCKPDSGRLLRCLNHAGQTARRRSQKMNRVRLMDMDDENRVDELMQQVYDDAFEDAYASFVMRKQRDPLFTRNFLQGLLSSLYVQ